MTESEHQHDLSGGDRNTRLQEKRNLEGGGERRYMGAPLIS